MNPANTSQALADRESAANAAASPKLDLDLTGDVILAEPATTGPHQISGLISPELDTTGPHQHEE